MKKLTEILENLAGVGKECKPRMSIDQAEQAIRKWADTRQPLSVDELFKIIEKHKWGIAKYIIANKTLDISQSSRDLAQKIYDGGKNGKDI